MASDGLKYDGDKDMWELFPLEELEGIVKVLTYGAKKYTYDPEDQNWKKVDNGKHRYFAAMMRHLLADKKGEKIDKESGHEHIDHFLFNAMAYSYFVKNNDKKNS